METGIQGFPPARRVGNCSGWAPACAGVTPWVGRWQVVTLDVRRSGDCSIMSTEDPNLTYASGRLSMEKVE